MKYLTILMLMMSLNVFAQEKEGDLQMPVSDLSQIEKQEEEQIPTIDEVEMKQEKKKSEKKKRSTSSDKTPASP